MQEQQSLSTLWIACQEIEYNKSWAYITDDGRYGSGTLYAKKRTGVVLANVLCDVLDDLKMSNVEVFTNFHTIVHYAKPGGNISQWAKKNWITKRNKPMRAAKTWQRIHEHIKNNGAKFLDPSGHSSEYEIASDLAAHALITGECLSGSNAHEGLPNMETDINLCALFYERDRGEPFLAVHKSVIENATSETARVFVLREKSEIPWIAELDLSVRPVREDILSGRIYVDNYKLITQTEETVPEREIEYYPLKSKIRKIAENEDKKLSFKTVSAVCEYLYGEFFADILKPVSYLREIEMPDRDELEDELADFLRAMFDRYEYYITEFSGLIKHLDGDRTESWMQPDSEDYFLSGYLYLIALWYAYSEEKTKYDRTLVCLRFSIVKDMLERFPMPAFSEDDEKIARKLVERIHSYCADNVSRYTNGKDLPIWYRPGYVPCVFHKEPMLNQKKSYECINNQGYPLIYVDGAVNKAHNLLSYSEQYKILDEDNKVASSYIVFMLCRFLEYTAEMGSRFVAEKLASGFLIGELVARGAKYQTLHMNRAPGEKSDGLDISVTATKMLIKALVSGMDGRDEDTTAHLMSALCLCAMEDYVLWRDINGVEEEDISMYAECIEWLSLYYISLGDEESASNYSQAYSRIIEDSIEAISDEINQI